MTTRRQWLIGAAAATCAAPLLAQAQTSPRSGVNRIIVGFAPGGSTDVMARMLAQGLQADGSTWIVENRPGAAGRLSIMAVKQAPADGRTLLLTPDPMMTVYPLIYRQLAYDPAADFTPITPIATVPLGIAVGPMVPDTVKTLADFAAWCQENPERAHYGTAGPGTAPHFIGEMFARESQSPYSHVPYRGGAPAVQDVLAGQIASSINVISEQVPLATAGRIRVLAVTGPTRSPLLPDVPTVAESGYPDLESMAWFGIFAREGTPEAQLNELHEAMVKAAATPAFIEGMQGLAYDVATSSPEAFTEMIQADAARWQPIVEATGYTAED